MPADLMPTHRRVLRDSDADPDPTDTVLFALFRPDPDAEPLPELEELADLSPKVRDLVLDRLDAAYRDGLLRLTTEQYADVLMAVLPEDFTVQPAQSAPSEAAPGTHARATDYRARAEVQEPLFQIHDAADRPVKTRSLRTPTLLSPKVVGWADDGATAPAAPAGMYRDARGKWFELC